MDGGEVEFWLQHARIIEHRAAIGPKRQEVTYGMLHSRQKMTNSVICQEPRKEIETKVVIRQCAHMTTQTKARLSAHLRSEMTPERIGYRMMLFREALEMSPAQIADNLEIPRTYWSRFEGGKRAISDDVAAMLVERFGLTLDFLILGRWDKLPMDLADKMRAVEARKNI